MQRRELPAFIAEVVEDRSALRTLGTATLALVAAGLDPRIASPFIGDVQSLLRARPDLEALASLLGVLGAATLLIGGIAGDALRTRRILQGGLAGVAVAALASLLTEEGTLFIASRIAGALAAGLVVPFAIAAVAVAYKGVARATAIGIAYAGFGLGSALPPILLTLTGPGGNDAIAYLAALVPAAAAAVLARSSMGDLPGTSGMRVCRVARIGVLAFGVIAVTAGIATYGSGLHPIRLATLGVGLAALLLAGRLWRCTVDRPGAGIPIDLRPVLVVLMAGLFMGLAQSVPMTLLPVFFQVISGLGPIAAVAAIGPIIAALVAAGPIAGWLLPLTSPRVLIGGGLIAIGIGDILIALVAFRGASYLLFILPFILVGAGFVIATTVRTAVIFASVPRDLPASAAALNEASVSLGSRIGVAVGSVVLTQTALAAYAADLPPGADHAALLAPLRDLLIALGTPNFAEVLGEADPALLGEYAAVYIQGIQVVHLMAGLIALVAGGIALAALGRRAPPKTMWGDHAGPSGSSGFATAEHDDATGSQPPRPPRSGGGEIVAPRAQRPSVRAGIERMIRARS